MPRYARAYSGPQCPYCDATLPPEQLRTGPLACDHCRRAFEATAFVPPERPPRLTQTVIGSGPEGANACSAHPGNAAVTGCGRCGLFICTLCEMNVGSGSYCPACFERIRAEGMLPEVAMHYRDYASMARLSIVGGIVIWFMAPLFAGLALYYSFKAMRQRREENRSRVGVVIFMLIAAAQLTGSLALFGYMFWGMVTAAGGTS
jgi:hypothetical protein